MEQIHTPRAFVVSWPLLLGLLVLILASASQTVLGDPDTLWHIAAGRWIVEHRQLPYADMFSWSMPGVPWTAHEWLSEVVFFGVYQLGGFPAIVAMSAVSFALLAALMARFLFDRMEPVHALPAVAIFLAVTSSHYLARPHVLVWPLMAWWTAQLVRAVESGRPPAWWSLAILTLWANLHASFTLGLGVAGAMALDAITAASTGEARRRLFLQWGAFGIGTVVAVALNPNGLGTLVHALRMMQMKEMLASISEWKSADFHGFQLVLLWIGPIFGLALMGRLRLSPVRALLVLGLFYMALKHARYHSTLALVSPFLLATPLGVSLRSLRSERSLQDAGNTERGPNGLDDIMARLAVPAQRSGTILGLLAACSWMVFARPLMPSEPPAMIAPSAAVNALQALGTTGPLLNDYRFGGYLILRRIPVFIDGRADMYGDPRIKEFYNALQLRQPQALPQLLEKYRIQTTLLDTKAPAVELLDHLPGWERVYGDSLAVVHVRRLTTPSAR